MVVRLSCLCRPVCSHRGKLLVTGNGKKAGEHADISGVESETVRHGRLKRELINNI